MTTFTPTDAQRHQLLQLGAYRAFPSESNDKFYPFSSYEEAMEAADSLGVNA